MMPKLIGIGLISIGCFVFWIEYSKTPIEYEQEKATLGLTDNEILWGRKNTLWRSFGLVFFGVIIVLFF